MRALRAAVLPVLAVLVLAAGVLLAPSRDTTPTAAPTRTTLGGTSYACPAGAGLAQATGQVEGGGSATARVLPGGEEQPDAADPDAWVTSEADGEALVVVRRGRGTGGVGFFSGVAPRRDGGGLRVGACPGTVDDAWFTGLGSGARHESALVLTNLADSPAVADVTLWGPEGRVATAETSGVVVDPGTTRTVELADLAAGEPELAVRVERRRGALSVTALDGSTGDDAGSEVVEAADAPRRRQVLGGVPRGAEGRTLQVLNPSGSTAEVQVEVLGEDGAFVPEGLEGLRVGPGRTREVAVPRSAGSGAVAVRLRSSVPVVAAVRTQAGDDDRAVAEPTGVLPGPAVVPLELGTGTDAPRLVLTAPDRAATVVVEAHAADGTVVEEGAVEVPAGATVEADLGDEDVLDVGDAAYVVLRPAGEVLGAATYEAGDGVASLALRPAPVTVLAPQVRREP